MIVSAQPSLLTSRSALNTVKFDRSWRDVSTVQPASIKSVEVFMQAHYLHRRPAITALCLMMLVGMEPVGTSVFSAPPKETIVRYGCDVWELARLYLLDEIPRNAETWLIAQSIKHIRRNYPTIGMLVSYADPSVGHSGTIYRAGNWIYDGLTDAERKTPRSDYVNPLTGQKYSRRGHVPDDVTPVRVRRQPKHRFLYPLR
jgi:hypothetical protein